MDFVGLVTSSDFIVSVLAAVSVAAIVFTFGAQFSDNKDMKSRIKKVAVERERLRVEEISRLRGEDKHARRIADNSNTVKNIVERFSLKKAFADDKTALNLARAGYRGPAAITTFVFLRFVVPIGMTVFSLLYFVFIFNKEGPLFMSITYAIGVGIVSSYLPVILLKNKTTKRQQSIRSAWSDCLDLLLLCVESGMSIEHAFAKVAKEISTQSEELGEELTLTTAELSFLDKRSRAFDNMAQRTGLDEVKSVMTALIQSDKYGTSVGSSLRVMAEEGREMRMMAAEQKAAALPPKLTVPLILFFLPVLFIMIMTPALLTAFAVNGPN
ncbi:type II secretion system F family protein [Maritalea porphyrae]|jgi:tight adherence protein C|uniref:type II secretion system F family protein n=2 Tax=Maritalea TaxID=623276 RepID=UPI0022AF8830|nr:type II secretion system F family protein [Maritalea porphyrae]MCZ4271721.1 type II secretion system F family protein [Maritalea porphyrae]